MATKKPAKKRYSSTSAGYKPTTKRPRPAKKAGKKGFGKKAGGGAPAEDPIIIGGGSVPVVFDKKFKVKAHASKHKFEHDNTGALVTGVVWLSIVGATTTVIGRDTIPTGANAVAVCYTGSRCF